MNDIDTKVVQSPQRVGKRVDRKAYADLASAGSVSHLAASRLPMTSGHLPSNQTVHLYVLLVLLSSAQERESIRMKGRPCCCHRRQCCNCHRLSSGSIAIILVLSAEIAAAAAAATAISSGDVAK